MASSRNSKRAAKRKAAVRTVDRTAPDFSLMAVVEEMSDQHLQCRDYGHSWRPYTARIIPGGYVSVQRCQRCTTLRERTLNKNGHVISSKYDYDAGYQIKGLGHIYGPEKDAIRLASLLKVLPTDAAE